MHDSSMTEVKKKKLDLKVIPALIPSAVGIAVAIVVLGNQIGALITSLVAGYFAFLMASFLTELIGWIRRKRR